jgi:hypothetical protein
MCKANDEKCKSACSSYGKKCGMKQPYTPNVCAVCGRKTSDIWMCSNCFSEFSDWLEKKHIGFDQVKTWTREQELKQIQIYLKEKTTVKVQFD